MKSIIKLFTALLIISLFTFPAYALDFGQKLTKVSDLIETGKPDSAVVLLYNFMDSIEGKNERVRALYYFSQAMGQLGRHEEEIQYLIMAHEESYDTDLADKINLEYSRMLLKTSNFDECIDVINKFRLLYTDSPLLPEILYIEGNAYFLKGEYRRASNIFSEITREYEESDVSIESIMKEGMCLFKLDFIGGAIERFEQYFTKNRYGENTAEALYFLGLCYEITLQPELCIEAYKRLTIDYPSYPDVIEIYYKLGINYFNTEQYTEAKNAFSNYIANTDTTDSNYNEALLHQERIAFKNGEYSSEIDIYENFITKYPENSLTPKILFDLAKYYQTMGKTVEVLEKYRILMTNPLYTAYSDSAAFLMADIYDSSNKRDESIALLKKLAYEKPGSLRTQKFLLKIGSLYEKWELFDTAISWYDSSFALQASQDLSVQALLGIGRIFKKLNRWMESGKTYERIIQEYPDILYIKDVYLALSNIYFLQGRLKDAALTAEKAVKYSENTEKTEILLHIADIYEEIDENHALQLYSIIFNNNRNSSSQMSEALLKYGDLALRMGDRESAVKAYAAVINNDADSVLVSKAREKLYIINEAVDDSTNIISEE